MPRTPRESSGETAAASVKSAARVLSIFEYFEKVRSARTLSEISQDLKYPVSSTLALLRSIQAMGYLNYNQQDKTYLPSIKFAMLGQWIQDELFQGSAIVQLMEDLAAQTQESVMLGIQNGLQSQYVRIVHTSQWLSYAPPVGTLRPILRSSVGRVLLCQQPEAAVRKIVERSNALGIDGGRAFNAEQVLEDLRQVKKTGYAASSSLFVEGAASVAVALPQRPGEVPMAIAVGGPSTRVNEKTVPAIARQIKQAIRKHLTASEAA